MSLRGGPLRSSASASTVPGWRVEDFHHLETDFMEEGVVSGLAVSERGAGANMSVDVAAGTALINVTTTLLSPNATLNTWLTSDAVVNVAISTADPTNPRIDRIVAKFDMTVDPNAASSNVVSITVVTGTPAGSPAAPAEPSNAITLALVSVPASDTTIGNAQITDSRTYVTLDTAVLADVVRTSTYTPAIGALRDDTPSWLGTITGTDTLTGSVTPAKTAYVAGQRFAFVVASDNTGSVTLNVNSLGAKTIKRTDGATNLSAADLKSGRLVEVRYDGTNMQLVSSPGNVAITYYDKVVHCSGASSSASGNVTTDTAFDVHSHNIDANFLTATTGYEFKLAFTATIGAGVLELGVMLGGTRLVASVAADGNEFFLEGFLVGTAAAGASVAVRGACDMGSNVPSSAGEGLGQYAAVNFATNGTLALAAFAKFGTSNGGNTATCTMAKFTKFSSTPFS